MPRKKGKDARSSGPQLVVRITEPLDLDLRCASDLLGVDMSNLVRMILTEHTPDYLKRGFDAKKRSEAARSLIATGESPPAGGTAGLPAVNDLAPEEQQGSRPGLDL